MSGRGEPGVPRWATELVGPTFDHASEGVRVRRSDRFSLLSLVVPDADLLDGPGLERASAEAYERILRVLHEGGPGWHALRFWNFVPGILSGGGDGLDRYMRFNAGRHRAFAGHFGGPGSFDGTLPTASAVGLGGRELSVHLLAGRSQGVAVANPRQRPPHQYSRRFGPLPPCFARATLLNEPGQPQRLLVGGTASIRGEESVFVGDLSAQLAETFENLRALIRVAWPTVERPAACYRALRVYHVRPGDRTAIQRAVERQFPSAGQVEWLLAELCRPDLLVEIEGLAYGA